MPMFNKRHYEAIARAFQDACYGLNLDSPDTKAALNSVRLEIVSTFARDNDLFKRDRFERACQPGANVRKRA